MLHHSEVTHSTSVVERQIPFSPVPLEVRLMIYRFAVVEPKPLTLISHLDRAEKIDGYGVDKDLRLLETCKELRYQMKEMFYSQNCFSYTMGSGDDDVPNSYKIHFKLIQKLHVEVTDLVAWNEELKSEADHDESFTFQTALVKNFPSRDYRLKYLLVECEPQDIDELAGYLHPLSLLRNISLVHFRSPDADIHPFFRSMERLMMGDFPDAHTDLKEYFSRLHDDVDYSWFEQDLDTETIVADKDKEGQIDATARELYSPLELGQKFITQSELHELYYGDFKAPRWHYGRRRGAVSASSDGILALNG